MAETYKAMKADLDGMLKNAVLPEDVARLGTARGKRARRKAREAQGFELNPPRCLNCERLVTPKHGAPETEHAAKKAYVAMACSLGKFQVKAWSICDMWAGRDGESLDDS